MGIASSRVEVGKHRDANVEGYDAPPTLIDFFQIICKTPLAWHMMFSACELTLGLEKG